MFAVSNEEVYVVGDSGVLLKYDGVSWSLSPDLPSSVKTTDLYSVWVDQGVLTITGDEGILVTGNATMGYTYLGSVAKASSLNDLWAGEGVMVAVGNDSNIFRLDGSWSAEIAPSTQHLRSVWGLASDDIWAVGLAGLLLHWDGVAWNQVITTEEAARFGENRPMFNSKMWFSPTIRVRRREIIPVPRWPSDGGESPLSAVCLRATGQTSAVQWR